MSGSFSNDFSNDFHIGDTVPSIYDMADTWNDGGTTFAAIKMDVTDTASNAESLLLDLLVGTSKKFEVKKDGALRIYNAYTNASNYERAFMRWASNVLEIGMAAAGTGTNRIVKLTSPVGTIIDGATVTQSISGASKVLLTATEWKTTNHVVPWTTKIQDLGSASLSWRNLYLSPSASLTPANNGNLCIEATSNTQLTFKYKGSDGTVRSNTLTLA